MKDLKNYRYHKDSRYPEAKKYRDEAEGSMKRDYDKLFTAGQTAQLEKLKVNEYKDDWNNMSQQEISELIDEEYDEVFHEMKKDTTDYKLLRLECADLKNALDFMICLCDKEIKK